MQTRSWIATCGVSALIVACASAPAATSGGTTQPGGVTPCTKLQGDDLAASPTVVLVRRESRGERTFRGCVRPWGRVFVVGSAYQVGNISYAYRLRKVVGPIVLGDQFITRGYASVRRTQVYDLRTGEAYSIAVSCDITKPDDDCPRHQSGDTAEQVVVRRDGRAAAAIVANDLGTTTIKRFTFSGTPTELDVGPIPEVPAASLRFDDGILTWSHGQEVRRATF